MAYLGMYKCRLCEEKYMRCSVPDSKVLVQQFIGLTTPAKAKQQIDKLDMHSCGNGNYGLADFIGFMEE